MKIRNEDFIVVDSNLKNKTTFILPNGYGVLNYVNTLSEKISKEVGKVIIPVLSGQNERSGILNIQSAKKDFEQIFLKTNKNSTRKVNIICHCSSLLYLSQVSNPEIWSKIEKVILYSFLANPKKHFARFKEKATGFGILISDEDFKNLDVFDNVEAYKDIPVPIHVIHPNTLMNKFRANNEDLQLLEKLDNVKSIVKPLAGYDIKDIPQHKEINDMVEMYFKPLL